MTYLEMFIREHECIERELLELETIMQEEIINYPNLVHVIKKITYLWQEHVKKEQPFLVALEQEGFATPLESMFIEQQELERHLQSLTKTMLCCSDCKTRKALLTDGRSFVAKMRQHIKRQDWVFYALPAFEHTPLTQKSSPNIGAFAAKPSIN